MQWDLAAKYLAGECSGEERRRFEQWLAEDPERHALLDSLRPYFADRTPAGTAVDVEAAWTRMAARVEREGLRVHAGSARAERWRGGIASRRWRLAAAAVLVVATAGSVAVVRNLAAPSLIDVATGPGEKREITLADGSRIVIGPLSRVKTLDKRRATLVGEAYFVVVHNPGRPFVVETDDALIQDLGTAFVVRAGPGHQGTLVAVEEGVVSLAPSTRAGHANVLILREGESGTISRGAEPVREDSATWSRSLAWTRGEIVFDRTRMRDVVVELNRWFGITATLSDRSLETRTFSARLSGESVDEVLQAIDRSLGVKHTRTGDIVLFHP